jgi:tRNA threonylcarbamoyladenosine biosynthesis protein TsaE
MENENSRGRCLQLADSDATERVGAVLATSLIEHQQACEQGVVVWMYGDLGAGKTTFVRGFMHAMGHRGAVKSPTYTLVEPYQQQGWEFYHFDLYRLGDPEELEYLGIRDYFGPKMFSLIEWPDRGKGVIPSADLVIHINYVGERRELDFKPLSSFGQLLVDSIPENYPN